MRRIDWLRTVLAVRRQREEIAERALVSTAREMMRWKDEIEQSRAGLAEITASRVREIHCVSTAQQHQCNEARSRALLRRWVEAENKLQTLGALRRQQMSTYIADRSAREVVEELEERCMVVRDAELSLRERKWNEDNFLARRVSNSNTL